MSAVIKRELLSARILEDALRALRARGGAGTQTRLVEQLGDMLWVSPRTIARWKADGVPAWFLFAAVGLLETDGSIGGALQYLSAAAQQPNQVQPSLATSSGSSSAQQFERNSPEEGAEEEGAQVVATP